jgi:hypothetical protein
MELVPAFDVQVEMFFKKPVKVMIHPIYLTATNI